MATPTPEWLSLLKRLEWIRRYRPALIPFLDRQLQSVILRERTSTVVYKQITEDAE